MHERDEQVNLGEAATHAPGGPGWSPEPNPVESFTSTIEHALHQLSLELAAIRAERDGLRLELEGLRAQHDLLRQQLRDRDRFAASIRELGDIVRTLNVPTSWLDPASQASATPPPPEPTVPLAWTPPPAATPPPPPPPNPTFEPPAAPPEPPAPPVVDTPAWMAAGPDPTGAATPTSPETDPFAWARTEPTAPDVDWSAYLGSGAPEQLAPAPAPETPAPAAPSVEVSSAQAPAPDAPTSEIPAAVWVPADDPTTAVPPPEPERDPAPESTPSAWAPTDAPPVDEPLIDEPDAEPVVEPAPHAAPSPFATPTSSAGMPGLASLEGVWYVPEGTSQRRRPSPSDRVSLWGKRVLSGLGVLVVLAILLVAVGPKVLPYQTFFVRSGSMEPAIEVGELIFLSRVNAADLEVGDIITFERPDREDVLVTHRIVAIEETDQGKVFQTKGDANGTPDVWKVPATGEGWRYAFGVPKVGYVFGYLNTTEARFALLAIPAAILGLLSLIDIWKPKNAKKQPSRSKR